MEVNLSIAIGSYVIYAIIFFIFSFLPFAMSLPGGLWSLCDKTWRETSE